MSVTAETIPGLAKSVRARASREPRGKLLFLDGLRGIAALYVVIHHEAQIYMGEKCFPQPFFYRLYPYMILGNFAVVAAIVMSGFCLMLSVVRSEDATLRGGLGAYLWRRFRRLAPGFYAAIAVSLLLVACVPAMRRHDGELWSFAFPTSDWRSIFGWKIILSHVLMLHALSPNWIMRIDPPMWSVGVEWINIFLMPLLLLPLWRRAGGALLAILATVLCFLPFATRPIFHDDRFTFQWAQPWLVAQFAYGMAAAALLYPKHTPERFRRLDRAALRVAVHPVVLVVLVIAFYFCGTYRRVPLTFLTGVATVCVTLHCALGTRVGRLLIKPLESGFALWLGMISYSLYLLHTPLQMLFQRAMEPLHLPAGVRLAALLTLATPLMLLAGAIGYRFFERPFLDAAIRSRETDRGPEHGPSDRAQLAQTLPSHAASAADPIAVAVADGGLAG